MFKKILLILFNSAIHLFLISGLIWLFWPFVDLSLRATKLVGYDSDQFIYYVKFFNEYNQLPQSSWDHLWFEGVPRILDYIFLPHYLIQPLVNQFGLSMATKVYPLFWLGIFLITLYLLFCRLSRNQLLAFVLTLGVMFSQSIYFPVYKNGVVASGLAQSIFPLIMLFLVLFAQTKSFRYLGLASLTLAFQLYTHAGLSLMFGFVPAVIFLFFYKFPEEKFISFERFKRFIGFIFMTFSVASLTIFPQVLDATQGGLFSKGPFGQAVPVPNLFSRLTEVTHPVLFISGLVALFVGIAIYKKRFQGMFFPFIAILLFFLFFNLAIMYGRNPFGDFLFPDRIFWFFSVIFGCLSSLLFSPLTALYKSKFKIMLPFVWIIISAVLLSIIINNPFDLSKFKPFAETVILTKTEGDKKLMDLYRSDLNHILKEVNPNDHNVRIWNHAGGKISWNIVSEVPQVEGYFHYKTRYSGEWTAWLNAVLVEEGFKNQTIPQDMADKQGQFLIDWYGIKYLFAGKEEEFNLAPRFYQKNDYVLRKSADEPPSVFEIKHEHTSGIIEAVNVPVIGFIGSEDGYNVFLRDLGMLNLNTHYLIPLRLGKSINGVSREDLDNINLLVLYGLQSTGGDWEKIADFVKKGGKLFIETGGGDIFTKEKNLPEVFPMDRLRFGSLGEKWQVNAKEDFSKIDFSKLKPLIYKNEAWKLSYVDDSSFLRDGGDILLTQDNKPIIVERVLNGGKIIWSGLNAWYRPWELKENGMKEVEFINSILKRLIKTEYTRSVNTKIQREKPEKILIEGVGFKGIVLKENNLGGWKGLIEANGSKKDLKLYVAGPDFMYFALPQNHKDKPVSIQIEYSGKIFYWVLFIISVFSLIFVVEEIISDRLIFRNVTKSKFVRIPIVDKVAKKVKNWWEKDEDEE